MSKETDISSLLTLALSMSTLRSLSKCRTKKIVKKKPSHSLGSDLSRRQPNDQMRA